MAGWRGRLNERPRTGGNALKWVPNDEDDVDEDDEIDRASR